MSEPSPDGRPRLETGGKYVPTRFDGTRQDKYLDGLRHGKRRTKAARAAGVVPETVRNLRKQDPAFAQAERDAEEEAAEVIEDALFEAASGGHVTAMFFYLQNRAPDRWKDMRTVSKNVKHEGTITHELEAGPALERIALLQARLTERAALRSAEPPVIDVQAIEPDRPAS